MAETVVVVEYPRCDFCPIGVLGTARYDFKTRMGPWANGCPTHYAQHRAYVDLGTDKGQLLVR